MSENLWQRLVFLFLHTSGIQPHVVLFCTNVYSSRALLFRAHPSSHARDQNSPTMSSRTERQITFSSSLRRRLGKIEFPPKHGNCTRRRVRTLPIKRNYVIFVRIYESTRRRSSERKSHSNCTPWRQWTSSRLRHIEKYEEGGCDALNFSLRLFHLPWAVTSNMAKVLYFGTLFLIGSTTSCNS